MALVVVRHRGGAAALHRQTRLRAIKRLDLAFLVNAQHQRLVRRVHVEADDVGDFFLELGIVRHFERLQMRLEAGLAPDALYAGVRNPDASAIERTVQCVAFGGVSFAVLVSTFALISSDERRRPGRPRLVAHQAIDAFLDIAFLPAPDRGLVLAGLLLDCTGAKATRRCKNDLSPPNDFRWRVAVGDEAFQIRPLIVAQSDCESAIGHGNQSS